MPRHTLPAMCANEGLAHAGNAVKFGKSRHLVPGITLALSRADGREG